MVVDPSVERAIERLSRAQNGAVTRRQLSDLGLSPGAIRARIARRRLIRLWEGVYATADPSLLPLVRLSAALLSLAPGAVLSHRSAAALWGFGNPDPRQTVDVTVPRHGPRRRDAVQIHRTEYLDRRDVCRRSNLALTCPARTLIDFAVDAAGTELTHAFGEARAKRRVNDRELHAALSRLPSNHRGAAIVRSLILDEGGTYDRSVAEQLMRRHLRSAALPQPVANVMLHGYLVDFLWPDVKVIVEVDGYATHGNRRAFENDRRRDQVHAAAGYVVVRITWVQLQREALAVVAVIAQAIARRAA
jgi:very-short-patch-repair endonuclease